MPEEYGGLGLDYLFDVVVFEELWRVGASGPGFLIHTDLVSTSILSFGSEERKRHGLPKMVTGEAIGALGMTEPHAGSDLKAVRARAVRDGGDPAACSIAWKDRAMSSAGPTSAMGGSSESV